MPAVVGFPSIVPSVSVSPGGSSPLVSDHVNVPVPPVAESSRLERHADLALCAPSRRERLASENADRDHERRSQAPSYRCVCRRSSSRAPGSRTDRPGRRAGDESRVAASIPTPGGSPPELIDHVLSPSIPWPSSAASTASPSFPESWTRGRCQPREPGDDGDRDVLLRVVTAAATGRRRPGVEVVGELQLEPERVRPLLGRRAGEKPVLGERQTWGNRAAADTPLVVAAERRSDPRPRGT